MAGRHNANTARAWQGSVAGMSTDGQLCCCEPDSFNSKSDYSDDSGEEDDVSDAEQRSTDPSVEKDGEENVEEVAEEGAASAELEHNQGSCALSVVCGGNPGMVLLPECDLVCMCHACHGDRHFTPGGFQEHSCGRPQSEWRKNIKVRMDGGGYERLGSWLDRHGIVPPWIRGPRRPSQAQQGDTNPHKRAHPDRATAADVAAARKKLQVTDVHTEQIPDQVPVTCNGYSGTLLLPQWSIRCDCSECEHSGTLIEPSNFRKHAGSTTCNWRCAIEVHLPGGYHATVQTWLRYQGANLPPPPATDHEKRKARRLPPAADGPAAETAVAKGVAVAVGGSYPWNMIPEGQIPACVKQMMAQAGLNGTQCEQLFDVHLRNGTLRQTYEKAHAEVENAKLQVRKHFMSCS